MGGNAVRSHGYSVWKYRKLKIQTNNDSLIDYNRYCGEMWRFLDGKPVQLRLFVGNRRAKQVIEISFFFHFLSLRFFPILLYFFISLNSLDFFLSSSLSLIIIIAIRCHYYYIFSRYIHTYKRGSPKSI